MKICSTAESGMEQIYNYHILIGGIYKIITSYTNGSGLEVFVVSQLQLIN
jgi:hypothetical protein